MSTASARPALCLDERRTSPPARRPSRSTRCAARPEACNPRRGRHGLDRDGEGRRPSSGHRPYEDVLNEHAQDIRDMGPAGLTGLPAHERRP